MRFLRLVVLAFMCHPRDMKHTTLHGCAAVALSLLGALGCEDNAKVHIPPSLGGLDAGWADGQGGTPGKGGALDTGGTSGTGGAEQPGEDGRPASADAAPDTPLVHDVGSPQDGLPGGDGMAFPAAKFACSTLGPLAAKGPLCERATSRVLFAKDRSVVVLQAKAVGDAAAGDDLLVVRLPGGHVTPIGSRVWDVEWLVEGSSVLVGTIDGDLLGVSLDGSRRETLASGSCDHTLSPDGRRLFSAGGCKGSRNGTPDKLDLVDTATGASTHVVDAALIGGYRKRVVVSPNSEFAALLTKDVGDAGGTNRVVRVLDRSGRQYAIASQPDASDVDFVSNDLLVFAEGRYGGETVRAFDLRGHVPGSGDQSYLIATGFDYLGNNNRYHFSRDGKLALAARSNSGSKSLGIQLAVIPLDGSGARVLADDMFDILQSQMSVEAFAFAGGDRYAVYLLGSPTFLVATVPLAGGLPRTLGGGGAFASSPVDDRLALPENPGGLRVVDVGTEQEVCQAAGAQVYTPVFLLDGRGLVFEDYAATGSWRLHYLSLPGCNKVELARLADDQDPDASIPPAPGFHAVDPTSCFAIVQSSARANAGTSLVVLPQ
jgi:hypothetical protein